MRLVHALRAFFLYACLSLVAANAYAQAQPLVDEQQLAALIELPTVQVIDIRSPEDYAADHISGAISAPYGKWRGPADNPGQLIAVEDVHHNMLIRTLAHQRLGLKCGSAYCGVLHR